MATRRILLIEDEIALAKVIGKTLKKAGYDVHAYSKADGAMKVIEEIKPHLVLTDIMMNGMTGLVFAQKVSNKSFEDENGPFPVKVMVMSALNDAPTKSAAKQAGAVEYFTKPLRLSDLRDKVKHHLSAESYEMIDWSHRVD